MAIVADGDRTAVTLADDVERIVPAEPYVVGPHSVAFILPGGRAEVLGAIARLEATCGARGRAVELEAGEDAVELLARLLSPTVSD